MTERIFVSYAHQDRALLGSLEQELRKHGVISSEEIVLIDPRSESHAGDNIRETIRDQIRSASKVVIIASESSANSQWVNYEAGMASALEKPIVIFAKKGSGKTAFLPALGGVPSIEMGEPR
jgi:nucleoside 2-deoxyribosyltransferase